MNDSKLRWRLAYYSIETVILLLGFSLIILFSFDFSVELMFLVITLIFYITFGLLRHQAEHDLKAKIVLEYILISGVILSAFLLLNSSRL